MNALKLAYILAAHNSFVMIRKLFLAAAFFFFAYSGYTQQAKKSANDTTAQKGSHQVKTVKTNVIKLDRPANQSNQPLPPMKTRRDTLMYLIQQQRQNKNNTK